MAAQRWATFDCYGTLIDWRSGIVAELERLFPPPEPEEEPEPEEVDEPEDESEIEDDEEASDEDEDEDDEDEEEEEPEETLDPHTESLLRRYHDIERELERDGSMSYRDVMTEAMRRLGAPEGEEGGLAASLPNWEPFPETFNALTEIRESGWKIAILSNSDIDFIEASKARIGVPIDETIVASQIHSYKPQLMHWFEFYARTLADKKRHVHIGASNYHDITPAQKLRIPNIWINREGEHPFTSPTKQLEDMYELGTVLDDLMPE
jgi:2-haloacid dehalogenase